jgi:hypothetical protein
MGWMDRFLTCEAYGGDRSVDRDRLVNAALPLLLWSSLLLLAWASGLQPLGMRHHLFGLGLGLPIAVSWTFHVLTNGAARSRRLSPLTRAYRGRLNGTGVVVGAIVCRTLMESTERWRWRCWDTCTA